jgi:long-chain-fatty-acid--[acyl-carrier-protein] ligase
MIKKFTLLLLRNLVKNLLRIRYRIHFKGLNTLTRERLFKKGGILFLPNHPAEVDPIILLTHLWPHFNPRPIVVEQFYYMLGAHFIMKMVKAIPLPDLNGAVNKWKEKKIEKAFRLIADDLKAGYNFLIYPSGRLKSSGEEVVGSASFVHNLLQEAPDTNIVLIRTTGLWGSRFSRAYIGTSPNFIKMAWEGVKLVFMNGVFFTPRRDVYIEIESAPANLPYKAKRLDFNHALEQWYNREGPEPLKQVSDFFWKKHFPAMQLVEKSTETDLTSFSIKPEDEKAIFEKIAEMAHKEVSSLKRAQNLALDIGLDSLDIAQLFAFLDERYDIENLKVEQLETVEDVLKIASRKGDNHSSDDEDEGKNQKMWPSERSRPPVLPPQGKTLQEAFLNICARMKTSCVSADALSGVMTYRRFKLAALTLAQLIRKHEGTHIGVLLPSSNPAYILIFAILLAKKTPVMLNWTTGVRSLDHCVDLMRLNVVISSRRFLDNLSNADLGRVDDKLILLEDMREEITLTHKIKSFYSLLKSPKSLMRSLELESVQASSPAVVLFTSGTESLPKAVPLSHTNLLSNMTGAIQMLDLQYTDIMYGVLPPFHSFGFNVTGILPILIGLKAYFAPDPNNSRSIARSIEKWETTIFCCAPTFIRGLFRVAKPEQLVKIRYFVSGAEKAPQELISQIEQLGQHTQFVEGYGVTECSPIVSCTPPGKPRLGVGQPIPGVHICIIDSEKQTKLSIGQEGEVCINGPNVFAGYIDGTKDPFVTIDNLPWYRTGDRGKLSEDGSLILSGRLKRFLKIGGEMISLGGLEEELLKLSLDLKWRTEKDSDGPSLAIGAAERDSEKPKIVLFTTFSVEKEDVNHALNQAGYARLAKIAEVRQLENIPILGTGKTNYRALDEMI